MNTSLTQKRLNHLLTGSIIAAFILLSPILFYSYKYGVFPEGKTWETSFFTLTSNYYESVSTFFWVFFGKFVPLYLMCIWFFTCRYWWYWSILLPIGMYIFQIISLFSEEFRLKDEPIDLMYIIPAIILTGVLLLYLRFRIIKYIDMFNLKERIDNQIKEIELEQ